MRLRLLIPAATALTLLPVVPAAATGVQRIKTRAVQPGPRRTPPGPRVFPIRPSNQGALRAAKAAAERRRARRERSPGASSRATKPRAAVFGGLNQLGLTAAQAQDAVPPDTTGSIGPSHYVEMVNTAVAVYSRTDLSLVSGPMTLEDFMGAPSGTLATDPQIQWDQQGQRWFYLATAFTQDPVTDEVTGPNYSMFGFSKTTDPSDLSNGWCRYVSNTGSASGHGNLLADFPKLGHDNQHIVFGINVFDQPGAFVTAQIVSLPKPGPGDISSCPAAPTATAFGTVASPLQTSDGDTVFTPVPANTADSSDADYVVSADDPLSTGSAGNQIMAWHVGGTASSPSLVADGNIGVSTYQIPPVARQPNGIGLDTLEAQLTNAVSHTDPDAGGAEAVWTQHTVDPGDGTVVLRWYELLPASLTRRQQGNVSDSRNDVFNGSASPADAGNAAAFFYNVSGAGLLPEMRAIGRASSTPLSATEGQVTLGMSTASDSDVSCTPVCRWGDYSGASPDQSNPNVVWGSNQAITAPGGPAPTWFTRNFAVELAPSPTPPPPPPHEPPPGGESPPPSPPETPGGSGTPGAGGGGQPGAGTTLSTPSDTTPALVRLGAHLQRLLRRHALVVVFRSNEQVDATFSASLSVPDAARSFRLRRVTVGARGRVEVRIRVSRAVLRRVRRALRSHRRVVAVLRVTAIDGAGNRSSARLRIRIRH